MASIRERKRATGETVWQVLYRHGHKQASRTFGSRQDAERWVARINLDGIEQALAWLNEAERPRGITVHDLVEKFIAHKVRDVTPRTVEDYRSFLANYIDPVFGHREADAVTDAQVQAWVDNMARRLKPKSVADRHMVLHSAYKFGRARTRNLVQHNPCTETELPKQSARQRNKGTTVAEWRAMLNASRDTHPDAHDLILFLGSTGWRFSEATALAVRDVEDDGETVHVNVTRVHRYVNSKPVLVEDAAKSQAGFRRIPVPTEAAAMLRRRVVGKGPEEYVFTTRLGRPWHQGSFLGKTWPKITKAAGVGNVNRKPTPHWLRHMAVAVMASAGVPLHQVQRAVGHENITTTEKTYGSLISGMTADVLPSIDAVLSGKGRAGQIVSGELVTGDAAPQVLPLSSPQVLQAHVDDID